MLDPNKTELGSADPSVHVEYSSNWERKAIFAFGVVFLLIMLVIAQVSPNPSGTSWYIYTTVLALAAGGIAALLPGAFGFAVSNWLKASGAIGVFALVLVKSPASLVVTPPVIRIPPPAADASVALPAGRPATREETQNRTLVFRFNKRWKMDNSCMTEEKSAGGNILACTIRVPEQVKGGFVGVSFACEPAGSQECAHTKECPVEGHVRTI